jgi:hypothetical protein
MLSSSVLLLAMSVLGVDDPYGTPPPAPPPPSAIDMATQSTSTVGETALVPHIGYGFSAYNHKPDATSSGVLADVEYMWQVFDWFSPRAYAGALITFPDRKSCGAGAKPCDVSNTIGFAGVKARLMAPFTYIAPYAEAGGGVSFGHINTLVTDQENKNKGGAFGHVEVGAGLTLGRKHEIDLGFMWFLHPSQAQGGGGVTLGMSIPL